MIRPGQGGNGGDQLLTLLQLANASFPTGAFSHSYGFEAWVAERVIDDAADAAARCRDWLRFGVATADAVAVAQAFRAALYGELDAIGSLDRRVGALKLSREARDASIKTGAALTVACREVFELEAMHRLDGLIKRDLCDGHHAVVFGVAAAALGLTEQQALASYLWSGFSGLVSVVARLVPLGQVEVQKIVAQAGPLIDQCVELARTREADAMSSLLVSLEAASMRHERLHARLCMS